MLKCPSDEAGPSHRWCCAELATTPLPSLVCAEWARVRTCMRMCVHAHMRSCMRTCVRECVRACTCAWDQAVSFHQKQAFELIFSHHDGVDSVGANDASQPDGCRRRRSPTEVGRRLVLLMHYYCCHPSQQQRTPKQMLQPAARLSLRDNSVLRFPPSLSNGNGQRPLAFSPIWSHPLL